jgi:hypothetical protein
MDQISSGNKKYFILIFLCSFFGCLLFLQVVMDDAYIPFRYGYNLIHYGIWNYYPPGRELEEAYTTFTYAVLAILPAWLNIHPYIICKAFGFLLFIAIITRLYRSTPNKRMALTAILFFCANWQTYVHAFSGLETMLWCWLFLEVIFLLDSDLSLRKQIFLWTFCLLLPLTRPEGILIGIFAFFYMRSKKIRIQYMPFAICVFIGILYFAWRYYYFGMLLPLPFYQKAIKNNEGVIHFIINTWSALHYIVLTLFFMLFFKKDSLLRRLGILTFVIFFSLYSRSLLTMNFADRFSYQLFFPVLLYGITAASSFADIQKIKIKYSMAVLIVFVFAKGFYSLHAKDFSSMGDNLFSGYYYSRTHLNLALHFRKLGHRGMKVFCNEAGIFPYYSNIDYYDPEGLTNKSLSKKTITPAYIEKINPDAFFYLVAIPKQEVDKWVHQLPPGHPLAYYKYLLDNEQYDKIGYVTCIEYNVYIGIAVNRKSRYYSEIRNAGMHAIADSEENTFSIKRFFKFTYSRSFPVL